MEKNINNILLQISNINKHYKEISRLSGEDFNVFKVLKLTTDEVRVHSAFLAELLNPKGTHGQGIVFLKYFVEKINMLDFDCSSASVKVENHISFKSDDNTRGGRVDILITDKNSNCIVIENKITAGDQDKQLIRYYNYCKDRSFKSFKLLYLTLYGNEASEMSVKSENAELILKEKEDYFVISYHKDILEWLEICRKEAATLPILREGITHYINLIKYLTNNSENVIMNNKVVDILLHSFENIEAANLIAANLAEAKTKVQWKFWEKLESALKLSNVELKEDKRNATYDKIREYYLKNKYPFQSLWSKVYEKDDLTIHWGAEIETNFYTGFTIEFRGEGKLSNSPEYQKYIELILSMNNEYNKLADFSSKSYWWLGWKYTEPILDFRNFNTEFVFRLTDDRYLDSIVRDIAENAKKDIEELRIKLNKL